MMRLRFLLTAMSMPLAIHASACAEEVISEEEQVSLLPHLEALAPTIQCIEDHVEQSDKLDVWRGGVSQGPATESDLLKTCTDIVGLDAEKMSDEGSVEYYQHGALFATVLHFGDHRQHLTTDDYLSAINYASCVEEKAREMPEFLNGGYEKSRKAARKAAQACTHHPLAIFREENLARASQGQDIENQRAVVTANSIANINISYILQSKGLAPERADPSTIVAPAPPPR